MSSRREKKPQRGRVIIEEEPESSDDEMDFFPTDLPNYVGEIPVQFLARMSDNAKNLMAGWGLNEIPYRIWTMHRLLLQEWMSARPDEIKPIDWKAQFDSQLLDDVKAAHVIILEYFDQVETVNFWCQD